MNLSIESVMDIPTATAIRDAAAALGITGCASMTEIRHRYHEEIKHCHPDVWGKDTQSSHQTTILLNESYHLLMEYCMHYRFSFRIDNLMENAEKTHGEIWNERFGDDPIWR